MLEVFKISTVVESDGYAITVETDGGTFSRHYDRTPYGAKESGPEDERRAFRQMLQSIDEDIAEGIDTLSDGAYDTMKWM